MQTSWFAIDFLYFIVEEPQFPIQKRLFLKAKVKL